MEEREELEETIEARLREFDPEVELIALEKPSAGVLRVYIDRPGGVDLLLCETVTGELRDLLERYSLEVSSPGIERPLTKPEHFRRFLGRRVKVKTREAIEGQKNFTGTLAEADDDSVMVAGDGAPVRIPLSRIAKSNLIADFNFGGKS